MRLRGAATVGAIVVTMDNAVAVVVGVYRRCIELFKGLDLIANSRQALLPGLRREIFTW